MKRGGYRVRRPASVLDATLGMHLEPVSARPCCVSGTVVLALLRLGVPASQIAGVCRIDPAMVRLTLQSPSVVTMRPEILDDGAIARLFAYLGIVVVRDLPEARAAAEAEAELLGCEIEELRL